MLLKSFSSLIVLCAAGFAAADFVVSQVECVANDGTSVPTCFGNEQVVPESAWNCDTLMDRNNKAGKIWYTGSDTFHVAGNKTPNFCGVKQLDAYRQCAGCANFDLYVAGGDGSKVGYCWPTKPGWEKSCIGWGGPTTFFVGVTTFDEVYYCSTTGPAATC